MSKTLIVELPSGPLESEKMLLVDEDTKTVIVPKKTNADRIRAMSDEELAEFLPIVSNFLCRPTDECMNTICNRGECEKTKECALEWLKSPTTD